MAAIIAPSRWTQIKPPGGALIDWAHPLSQGLIGCWILNEGSGAPRNLVDGQRSTIFDLSWTPSPSGSAVKPSTYAGNVTTGMSPVLNDFTAIAWFFAPSVAWAYERVVEQSFATSFWLGRSATAASTWGGGVMETGAPYGRFITLGDGARHQIVSRRSGTTHHVIGDGGAATTSGTVSGAATSPSPLIIANEGSLISGLGGGSGGGYVECALLYTWALPDALIAWNFLEPYRFLHPQRLIGLGSETVVAGQPTMRRWGSVPHMGSGRGAV